MTVHPIHPYTRLYPDQSIAPTVSDDSNAGYEIGDWWHVTGGSLYVCRDSSAGAAVWDEIGGHIPTEPLIDDECNILFDSECHILYE